MAARRAQARNATRMYLTGNTLSPTIRALPGFVDRMIRTTMRYYEPQVENAAKRGAPWTDQTTNARNGLVARSGKEVNTHYIVLAHQVPYGIWLEVRFGAKNATIMPTINEYGPKVMGTLEKILDRYKAGGL